MSERKPLTLEELRKMDGKPVWVECLNPYKYNCPPVGWRILSKAISGRFGVWDRENCLIERDYGTDWTAYDHEPPCLDRSAWEPCEHCKPSKNPLDRWGPHQFPIDGNEIYCYDIDDGWEGEEINFCPWCSRPLTDAAWDMLEKRLEGARK